MPLTLRPRPPATRVVTLLPAATEIICALGAADRLVGISHECDHPPEVQDRPRVTTTPIDVRQPGARLDEAVREARAAGRPVIGVDAEALRALAPDLVVTQQLCEVCAVADGEVLGLARAMQPAPRVLTLGGRTWAGVLETVRECGAALGAEAAAAELTRALGRRMVALGEAGLRPRPRVLCLEWLEPAYTAGHWVPDLVHAAGGLDVGAAPGEHSRVRTWAELAATAPDVVLVMPCGFDLARARRELHALRDPAARAVLAGRPVWLLDGNAYTSRPGPRLVDGAERIAAALRGETAPGLARFDGWTEEP